MAEKKAVKSVEKAKKLADPVAATLDVASQQMIQRAQELGIDTVMAGSGIMKRIRSNMHRR